jgi:hypothetical protein
VRGAGLPLERDRHRGLGERTALSVHVQTIGPVDAPVPGDSSARRPRPCETASSIDRPAASGDTRTAGARWRHRSSGVCR